MGEYKKYYKKVQKQIAVQEDGKSKKYDLSKPLPLSAEKISQNHEKLIKNAMIIQQRQFNRINDSSPRTRAILVKHNDIMRKKSFEKVIDIFKLIAFLD